MSKKKSIVLLSGGIDSATTLAYAIKRDNTIPYALSFNYGQRHRFELEASKKIAKGFGVEHIVFDIDLTKIGGSALTDKNINVPSKRGFQEIVGSQEIPITYVPARNTIFLSIALAYGEVLEAYDIYIGVNAIDYSGYPDCRPEFIEAYEKMANLGTKAGTTGKRFKIHTPLIKLKKSEIIKLGHELGVDFSLTLSCYNPTEDGKACGVCDSCIIRKKAFQEAGIEDPTEYANT